ncbi:MAG: hypothetical protein ACD_46C00161G0002 [uncultured bacterium]|nr:MAG: hypothetical protein ACD_46C00161G0002 [uncultured bacterium]
MAIVLIFAILLIAVIYAWLGNRKAGIYSFIVSFIFSIALFYHHMTDVIGISL